MGSRNRCTSPPVDPRRVSLHTRVLRDIMPLLLFRRWAAGSGRFIFAWQTSSLPAGLLPPLQPTGMHNFLFSPLAPRPRGRFLFLSLTARDFTSSPRAPCRIVLCFRPARLTQYLYTIIMLRRVCVQCITNYISARVCICVHVCVYSAETSRRIRPSSVFAGNYPCETPDHEWHVNRSST